MNRPSGSPDSPAQTLENERTWRRMARNPQFWENMQRLHHQMSIVMLTPEEKKVPSWMRREGD